MDKLIIAAIAAAAAPFILMLGLVFGAVVGLALAWPLQLAWNYAVPAVFGLPAITYWQSFCLYIVATMLVRSSNTNTCK